MEDRRPLKDRFVGLCMSKVLEFMWKHQVYRKCTPILRVSRGNIDFYFLFIGYTWYSFKSFAPCIVSEKQQGSIVEKQSMVLDIPLECDWFKTDTLDFLPSVWTSLKEMRSFSTRTWYFLKPLWLRACYVCWSCKWELHYAVSLSFCTIYTRIYKQKTILILLWLWTDNRSCSHLYDLNLY